MSAKRGRPERHVDANAGPTEAFAQGLRDLRAEAGLTYAQMARRAHFGASTLSQAATGMRLPSLDVALAYVRACGGDESAWKTQWEDAHAATDRPEEPSRVSGGEDGSTPGWLAAETTSFIGREPELETALTLLQQARLVTLTGAGGVGKTRLAMRIARQAAGAYRDGVRVVELADLSDPGVLAEVVASALALGDDPARDAATALVTELAPMNLLLVLDNCEHLHAACAALAQTLLRAAPGVTILTTSRQALAVGGEHVFAVAPLVLPVDGPAPSAHEAQRYDALRLFADRATAVQPGFRLTDDNVAVVTTLCRRLDGLPLAIELAARWLRVLTVGQLLARLDETFTLASMVDPTAHPRHRTMRALLDWSRDLCTDNERGAWARASLAVGTMPLELVEELVAVPQPLAAVSGIVDKSLLVPVSDGEVTRFQMPETIRAYGLTLLDGEHAAAARLRHLTWCRRLAEDAEKQWYGPAQVAAFARIRKEHHHVRMALSAQSGAGAADRMRTAASLWLYWIACGHLNEGRRALEAALAQNPTPGPHRAYAVWACGFVALVQGDLSAAARHCDAAEAYARRSDLRGIEGRAKMVRGLIHLFSDELDAAVSESRAALAASEAAADLFCRQLSLAQLALTHTYRGELDAAWRRYADVIPMAEDMGEQWHLSYVRWIMGLTHLETGNPAAAVLPMRQCVQTKRRFNDWVGAAAAVEGLGWAVAQLGDPETAAHLVGAAEAIRPAGAVGLFGMHRLTADSARHNALISDVLGEPRFTAAYRAGALRTKQEALDFALASTETVG
ncbi:ATP-binding protein [Embleya sp. NPDC001921]